MSLPNRQEEQKLLAALAGGDIAPLAAIYDVYSAPVYHLLLARLSEHEAAEDVLIETFLALTELGKGAANIRNLRAYLFKVARNKAAQAQQRRKDRISKSANLAAEPVRESSANPVLDVVAIRDALTRLPVEQSEVVVLKLWEELTFAEISEVVGISANTAASRYRYGLEKLRTILGESYDGN